MVIKFKNFYEFEKTMVQICRMHIEVIRQQTSDFVFLKKYILNNTTVSRLKDFHQNVDRFSMIQGNRTGSTDVFTAY
jgi:hypothetical protein